jgi:hypothetical protein
MSADHRSGLLPSADDAYGQFAGITGGILFGLTIVVVAIGVMLWVGAGRILAAVEEANRG